MPRRRHWMVLASALPLVGTPAALAAAPAQITTHPTKAVAAPFEPALRIEPVLDLQISGPWRAWTQSHNLTPRSRAPHPSFEVVRCGPDSDRPEEVFRTAALRGGRKGTQRLALDEDGTVVFFDPDAWALCRCDAQGTREHFPLEPVCEQEWVSAVFLDGLLVQRLEGTRVRIDAHLLGEHGLGPARKVLEQDGSDVHHALPIWIVRGEEWCAVGGPSFDGLIVWRFADSDAAVEKRLTRAVRPCWIQAGFVYAILDEEEWTRRGNGSVALVDCAQDRSFRTAVPMRPASIFPDGVLGGGTLWSPANSIFRPCEANLAERREVIHRSGSSEWQIVFGPARHTPADVLQLEVPKQLPPRSEDLSPSFPDAHPVEIERARSTPYEARNAWSRSEATAEQLRGVGMVLLYSEDPNLRNNAALYLAQAGGSWARPWIRAALKGQPDARGNSTLSRALTMCGTPEDGAFLLELHTGHAVADRDWDWLLPDLVLLGAPPTGPWLREHAPLLTSRIEWAERRLEERRDFDRTWVELYSAASARR